MLDGLVKRVTKHALGQPSMSGEARLPKDKYRADSGSCSLAAKASLPLSLAILG